MSAIAKENSEQKNKSLFSLALRCYQSSLFCLFSFVDTFKKLLTLHKTKQKKTGVAKCFFFPLYIAIISLNIWQSVRTWSLDNYKKALITALTRFNGCHDCTTGFVDGFINITLIICELAIGWKRTSDVWRIAIVFSSHVKQAVKWSKGK